jgi:NAD(P)-dependent dehydrogenase (short-subunit alcohol dehydrogenase family)
LRLKASKHGRAGRNKSGRNIHIRDLFSLKGRVALVTGGAGRVGRQISQALAEAGATVIIASRNVELCEEFARELERKKLAAQAMTLDLTSDESVEAAATEIRARWKKLDILVNAAATRSTGAFDKYSVEEWERAMQVNASGLFRASRSFGKIMTDQKSGTIVNIGSIYGVVSPDFAVYGDHAEMVNPPSYGFAKAGMVQLTRYMAVSFAPHGVRVNCISPGGVYSPTMPKDFVANYCGRTPLGRLVGPNDLKGAAVFFASDASAYVTGQNLMVDGGYTIK